VETDTFVLHWPDGDEAYATRSATIGALDDNGVELCLSVYTQAKPSRARRGTSPTASVNVPLPDLDAARLVGRELYVASGLSAEKQDVIAALYLPGERALDRNVVRFLERDENRFLVHWTAEAPGVSEGKESQPAVRVEVLAWFTFRDAEEWTAG
jgi:hypothetical protein